MKKKLLIAMIIILGANSIYADGKYADSDWFSKMFKTMNCDKARKVFYRKLNYGSQYTFYLDVANNSNVPMKFTDVKVLVGEKYDFDGQSSFPAYKWADAIIKKKGVLMPGETVKVREVKTPYPINSFPPKKAKEINDGDLILAYTLEYKKKNKNTGEWDGPFSKLDSCIVYSIDFDENLLIQPEQKQESIKEPETKVSKKVVKKLNTISTPNILNTPYGLPKKHMVYTPSGCALLNPYPTQDNHQSITWTGSCVNGALDGAGVLQWYKDGKKDGEAENIWLSKGTYTIDKDIADWGIFLIEKTSASNCKFVFPNSYAHEDSPIFDNLDIEYVDGCKNNANNKVNIYLNGEIFARYNGEIIKHAIPANGELEFMNGDIYQMGKEPEFYAILTTAIVRGWSDGIHLLRHKRKNEVNPELFDIRLGFDSDVAPIEIDNQKALGLNLSMTSTDNIVTLNYDVKAKNPSMLNKKRYIIDLQVEIKYHEKTIAWGMGSRKDKEYLKKVSIILEKENNYQTQNSLELKKFFTYINALGTTITLSDFKYDVKVLSIYGE